jgi:dTDP-L-rhamnose 4-epimerase
VLFEEGISRFAKWVSSQNIAVDAYETSVQELKDKGLYK